MVKITSELLARAAKKFAANAELEVIHITSDGQMFYNDNHATVQAKNLKEKGKDDDVYQLRREDAQQPEESGKAAANSGNEQPKAPVALTPLDIARGLAKECDEAEAAGADAVAKAAEKIKALEAEKAAMPATATAAKVNGLNVRMANAAKAKETAEAALVELKAKAAEAAEKVKTLEQAANQ